ncbi:aminodeoxychorismate synthase component I [Thioalkalicoccus limnaeus]|uniref:aminodeoxychorismate synthase n=1 Tax=Thioalkalicoccus limnaeus TaxID=120681 RepID=A0ABV4BDU7_9GAMM
MDPSRDIVVREQGYHPDSSRLFPALRGLTWPIFLDSGRPWSTLGRYDILTAEPGVRLITRGGRTHIDTPSGKRESSADPLELLAEQLGPRRAPHRSLPFVGGALGYFGYDLARRFQPLPDVSADGEGLPELAVGLFDWALVVDHVARRSHLVATDPSELERRERLFAIDPPSPYDDLERRSFRVTGSIRSNLTADDYLAAVARIQHYLREGDCYQVNLAQRFWVPADGDPWPLYLDLRRRNPAPYGAYLDIGEGQILCSSPERFLTLRGDQVVTSPIKGTRPRGRDPEADRRLRDALWRSPKDRAENLMIVDLLRNDLGKVCAIGSVRCDELFQVKAYPNVHHLVSSIRGRLAAGVEHLDLLRACFPGGSITGAPKRRAMEIIEELEPHRRGVYCGAIGYLGFDGAMDTNIAIRTLVYSSGIARFWAGAGIVADSDPLAEYRETRDKIAPIIAALKRTRDAPRPDGPDGPDGIEDVDPASI